MGDSNPELQAQRLMGPIVNNGDMKGFNDFVKDQVEPGLLDHILDQLRVKGNEAFRRERFTEAIEFYDQALVGTKDVEHRSILMSNKSAALVGQKKLNEALEVASQTIQMRPSWSKGWFRAGKALFEMKSYTSAMKVFNAALLKEPGSKDIQKWIKRTEPLAAKEKALERLTVDYARFDDIGVDDVSEVPESTEGSGVLEFAENVSEEEKSRLEKLLSGQSAVAQSPAAPPLLRPTFNPKSIFEEMTSRNELAELKGELKIKDKVKLGLLNILHTQSEINVPKRIAQQLLTSDGVQFLQRLTRAIETLVLYEDKSFENSFFFLGIGTCVPLLTAINSCNGNQNVNASFVVCTNHTYPFLAWMAERMLSINDVRVPDNLKIISKHIHDLTIGTNQATLLDAELVDISSGLSRVLIIDPDSFDPTGIARRVLFDIREARRRLVVKSSEAGLVVIPSRMRLSVHAAELKTDHSIIESKSVDRARWSVNWERFNIQKLHGGYRKLSPNIPIFDFIFDGPIDSLVEDIPISDLREFCIQIDQAGCFNAFVLSVEFDFPNEHEARVNHHISDLSSSAVLFMDSFEVKDDESIRFEASHDGSRLRLRIKSPHENPVVLRSHSIPRWQFDVLDDSSIIDNWNLVLRDTVEEKFKGQIDRLDRRPNLVPSKSHNIEVLLFNSCLGHLSVQALQTAASTFAARRLKPCPTFHVTAIETSISQAAISRYVAKENHRSIVEDNIILPTVGTSGLEWTPFADGSSKTLHGSDDKRKFDLDRSDESVGHQTEVRCDSKMSNSHLMSSKISDVVSNKLRSRLSTLLKDPRQLRPPNEDGVSRLALARLLKVPMGGSGPELPPGEPSDYLNDKLDVFVSQMIDTGLLGEGILPILTYCWEALSKPNATVIPIMARICAMGVHIGTPINATRTDCWSYLISGTEHALSVSLSDTNSEYSSIAFDDSLITQMTAPITAFEFNFDRQSLLSKPKFDQSTLLILKTIRDGSINGIVFWFDLLLESCQDAKRRGRLEPIGLTTRPASLSPLQQHDSNTNSLNDSWPSSLQQSKHGMQAVQLLSELVFQSEEDVPVIAAHSTSSVCFRWDEAKLTDINIRKTQCGRILSDPRLMESWLGLCQRHMSTINRMTEIYTDTRINRLVRHLSTFGTVQSSGTVMLLGQNPCGKVHFWDTFL